MRVLIFHGYLLHGTGSNVYNARLAEALVRAGHEVHLLCQDRDPLALDWVDAAGDWDSGTLEITARREPAQATVYRPDIHGLLPLAPSRSRLPWSVETLRFCNWCDQPAQKDLNDCPTCGRRMSALPRVEPEE